jgi:hypothetical protein
VRKKRRIGRPPKHGGYSLVYRSEIIKEHPELRRHLDDTRTGLIQSVAGLEENLSEQQRLIIDRTISQLALARLEELYIEKYGILRKDQLRRGILEVEPILNHWMSLNNSIRNNLALLGMEKRQVEETLTPLQIAAEIDKEKEEEAEKRARLAQRGQSQSEEARESSKITTDINNCGDTRKE